MSDYESLTVSVADGVARIRFTRPDLHNRFDEILHAEFPRALAALPKGQDVAALIISAEGVSFSAGGDFEMIQRANGSKPLRDRLAEEGLAIIEGLLALPYPVIAAVQGAAVGVGATVMSCADIVVAWRGAKIADPHVRLGLVAGDGGILGWSHAMGIMRAKRYLLTGDALSAADAFTLGLVSDLVETPADVLPAAEKIAARVAALPRGGVRGTKRAFSRLMRDLYGAAFELSFAYEAETLGGAEVAAVIAAALARR